MFEEALIWREEKGKCQVRANIQNWSKSLEDTVQTVVCTLWLSKVVCNAVYMSRHLYDQPFVQPQSPYFKDPKIGSAIFVDLQLLKL
jgi:hypothetical protein